MKYLRSFGAFWYDFVVGDDWRLAVGAAVAIGGTAVADALGIAAWWVAPIVVVGMLAMLVARAQPPQTRPPGS
jgi:hypothetical protein